MFDTLKVTVNGDRDVIKGKALEQKINLGSHSDGSVSHITYNRLERRESYLFLYTVFYLA